MSSMNFCWFCRLASVLTKAWRFFTRPQSSQGLLGGASLVKSPKRGRSLGWRAFFCSRGAITTIFGVIEEMGTLVCLARSSRGTLERECETCAFTTRQFGTKLTWNCVRAWILLWNFAMFSSALSSKARSSGSDLMLCWNFATFSSASSSRARSPGSASGTAESANRRLGVLIGNW